MIYYQVDLTIVDEWLTNVMFNNELVTCDFCVNDD